MGKKPLKKLTLKEKKELKMKEVDMPEIKSKIKNEFLKSFGTASNDSNNNYEQKYGEYMTEELNAKCVFLIVSFVNSSSTLPTHLKNQLNIHKELLNIIKELMMNEFEIILFTMYIDDIGWEKKDFKPKLHLLCIAIFTKCHTNRSIEFFINHFKQVNKDFADYFLKWREDIKETSFSTIDINERFRLLNKPHNTYCQKNYIDYNSVVDKIIQLSQPYGEDNKGNMIIKEDNTLDQMKIPQVQPFYPQVTQKMNHNEAIDPLMLKNNSRFNSFLSISSKKDEQDENNILDLMNSKSYINDPMPQSINMGLGMNMKTQQPSEFFSNFYPGQMRREQSSNIFDSSELFNMNKAPMRMKSSNLSNIGDSKILQPLPIAGNNFSMNSEFFKSFDKEKKDF